MVVLVAAESVRRPIVLETPAALAGATASTLYPVTGAAPGTASGGVQLTATWDGSALERTAEKLPAGAPWSAGPAGAPSHAGAPQLAVLGDGHALPVARRVLDLPGHRSFP